MLIWNLSNLVNVPSQSWRGVPCRAACMSAQAELRLWGGGEHLSSVPSTESSCSVSCSAFFIAAPAAAFYTRQHNEGNERLGLRCKLQLQLWGPGWLPPAAAASATAPCSEHRPRHLLLQPARAEEVVFCFLFYLIKFLSSDGTTAASTSCIHGS